jgi:hypothetical protein
MSERASDPRAEALADYLRQRASAFSLSADATGEQHIATAGMSLLDAAALAESLPPTDHRLEALSRQGRFETMRGGASRFVETPEVRAVIQRPLSGTPMTGEEILALMVATTRGT